MNKIALINFTCLHAYFHFWWIIRMVWCCMTAYFSFYSISHKSAINLFFQINVTSNKRRNQTMAKFQESDFLFLYTVLKFIYNYSMLMAVSLLIQNENNECCINTNAYGKVLCEYNFCCDLSGEILMDMFF